MHPAAGAPSQLGWRWEAVQFLSSVMGKALVPPQFEVLAATRRAAPTVFGGGAGDTEQQVQEREGVTAPGQLAQNTAVSSSLGPAGTELSYTQIAECRAFPWSTVSSPRHLEVMLLPLHREECHGVR